MFRFGSEAEADAIAIGADRRPMRERWTTELTRAPQYQLVWNTLEQRFTRD